MACTATVRSLSDYALAYVRTAPATEGAILGVVRIGATYSVLEAQTNGGSDWLRLDFEAGIVGWVRDDVFNLQGDCSAQGYGVISQPTQGSTLNRTEPPAATPPPPAAPTPAPVVAPVGVVTPTPAPVVMPVGVVSPPPSTATTPAPTPSTDTPDRVRKAAFNITAGFEGGRYDSYQNVDAGIVSYGRFQFTLASGSLFSVLDRYLSRASGATVNQLRDQYRQRTLDRDANLRGDTTYRDLLKAAAADPIMQTVQEEIATELYWNLVQDLSIRPRNLVLPLSQAFLFDTAINQGARHDMISLAEQSFNVPPKSRVPDNGITEQQLIGKVVEIRHDRLYKIADAQNAPGLKPRADFWVTLVQSGDWNLQGDSKGTVQIRPGQFIQVKTP